MQVFSSRFNLLRSKVKGQGYEARLLEDPKSRKARMQTVDRLTLSDRPYRIYGLVSLA